MTPASPCLEKKIKIKETSLLVQIWKDGKENGKEDGMLTWIRRSWSSIRSITEVGNPNEGRKTTNCK
jgi:hypothetical protein